MARRQRYAQAIEPNVIPFIDVLLVLLIIFMVTAPKPTTDLRVDLPAGRAAAAQIEPTIISLRRADGGMRIFIGDDETTLASLANRTLAHALAADPALAPEDVQADARIYVRADLDIGYQDVVRVVDELQHARFQRVAIAAQNADT